MTPMLDGHEATTDNCCHAVEILMMADWQVRSCR